MSDNKLEHPNPLAPYVTSFLVAVIIVSLLTAYLKTSSNLENSCKSAIAAIRENRQLELYITFNPYCATFLKPEDWPQILPPKPKAK